MERKNKLFSSHFDENKTPILIIALYLAVIEHVIYVRQVRLLPPASFRFHLTMDTLAFGYMLPVIWAHRDFHPLEHAHAGRTRKRSLLATSLIRLFKSYSR